MTNNKNIYDFSHQSKQVKTSFAVIQMGILFQKKYA